MESYWMKVTTPREGLESAGMFRILQDAAAGHSRSIGCGEEEMRRRDLMWVVIRYGLEAERWPAAGESLTVETWPGQVRHGMCPRYYLLRDEAGELLVRAAAIWAVVDRHSRQMLDPRERGLEIPALVTGQEPRLPGPVRRPVTEQARSFTVPESYLDENGHMNNTRYFALAEDCLGMSARDRGLESAEAEYVNEALAGETLLLRWGLDGRCGTVTGEAENGQAVFRMRLRFRE